MKKILVFALFLFLTTAWLAVAQAADDSIDLKPPVMPQNNCGAEPPAGSSAHNTYTACTANYNSQMHNYGESMRVYNEVNTGLQQINAAGAQAQANQEAQKLEALQSDSAAGTLQQAEKKTSAGKTMFKQVAGVLGGVAIVYTSNGTKNAAACASCTACTAPCLKAAASFAAAAVFNAYMNKADDQSARMAAMEVSLCEKKNQLSSQQQNCFNIAQANQNPFPNAQNIPLQPEWLDKNGQCLSTAPSTCQARQTEIKNAQALGITLPKLDANCAGGGTSCMANGYKPIVTETPKGKKYTVKSKDGKEFSFFESDLTDVKALINNGMKPKDAAAFASEMTAIVDSVAKKELAAKKDLENLNSIGAAGMDSKISFGSGTDPNAAGAEAGGKVYKDDLKPVEEGRKPSAVGLAKDFHGDLIGSSADSIFSMMNRRYQLKNEQDTFITPE